MSRHTLLPELETRTVLERCRVIAAQLDGTVLVSHEGDEQGEARLCDLLSVSDLEPLRLAPGDSVLVWSSSDESERAIILGRIGSSHVLAPESVGLEHPTVVTQKPDELVLEATHSLTLRVGEGSITIREDGKILIKGKDLVSHAQRMNRIKGGAVSIN
jgi:hypothetical protein